MLGTSYLIWFRAVDQIVAGLRKGPGFTDLAGFPVGSDFVAFWAAARLALDGDPAAAYSSEKLYPVETQAIGAKIPPFRWNYPPTFQLLVLPLGFLPYLAAAATWMGLTLMGYLKVLRSLAPNPLTPWLFLAFPPAVNNLFYGQNGFLSALLVGGGLLLLEDSPWLGGFLLGLLTYKPQLAVLIPVALLAGRRWRALGGAAVAAAGLALASLVLLGPGVWSAFFNNLSQAAGPISDVSWWQKMPTVFAAAISLGAGVPLAAVLQGAVALVAIIPVVWLWAKGAGLPHRGAILALGTFLVTPYALEYDLAVLGLAFAWLGWEAHHRDAVRQEFFLMAAWAALFFASFTPQKIGFQVTPAIVLALMLFVIYPENTRWPRRLAGADAG